MLDTRSEVAICQSLADILGTRKEAVEVFWAKAMPEYVNQDYWEITTRLLREELGEFRIDNLETVLLTENPMTALCKEHDIIFKREEGIAVYYRGKRVSFNKPMEVRLRNRLDKVNDSCVNGFLFSERMDDSYIGLTGMPEIFEH